MRGQFRPPDFEGKLAGFIYLATNSAMPGIVRVGRTQNWPTYRIAELSSPGVPEPFSCKASEFFVDCFKAEEKILAAFSAVGAPCDNKLFFKIEEAAARKILKDTYWNQYTHYYYPDDYKLEAQTAFEKALREKGLDWSQFIARTLRCLPYKERAEELSYLLAKALELGAQDCAQWLVSKCGVDPEVPLPLDVFEIGIDQYGLTAYETAIYLGHHEFEKYLAGIGCALDLAPLFPDTA